MPDILLEGTAQTDPDTAYVIRRVGGLEVRLADLAIQSIVIRRVGGLEASPSS